MTDTITLPRAWVEQALGALVRAEMMHGQPNQAAQDALRAALEQPLSSSDWKLVPTTMTNDMAQADKDLRHAVPWVRWEAILAAAPQPPVVKHPETVSASAYDRLQSLCDSQAARIMELEQPQVEHGPVAYATHDTEGSPSMLFFDRREAEGYCDDGEEPTPLYARTQPQVEQEPTPNGATHRQPKQGAFYKRVDGKWYVWSRMENGGPHRWYISPGTIEGCLEPLCTHPQNLNCKSNQARLATLWGYEKPQPKRDPLTDAEILKLGWAVTPYANQMEMLSVARAVERAHEIECEAKTRMCPSSYCECSRDCGDGGCKDFSDAHGADGGVK